MTADSRLLASQWICPRPSGPIVARPDTGVQVVNGRWVRDVNVA